MHAKLKSRYMPLKRISGGQIKQEMEKNNESMNDVFIAV